MENDTIAPAPRGPASSSESGIAVGENKGLLIVRSSCSPPSPDPQQAQAHD